MKHLSKDQYHINRIKDRLSSTAAGMSSTANRFLSRLVNIYWTEQSVTRLHAANSNMFKVTLVSQQQPPLQAPRTWSRNRRPSRSTGSPYYLKRFYYTHSFARTAAAASLSSLLRTHSTTGPAASLFWTRRLKIATRTPSRSLRRGSFGNITTQAALIISF